MPRRCSHLSLLPNHSGQKQVDVVGQRSNPADPATTQSRMTPRFKLTTSVDIRGLLQRSKNQITESRGRSWLAHGRP